MVQRVVSFIPSATEILGVFFAPGEGIVGVTHECDCPKWVADLPRVIRPRDPNLISMTPPEVDRRVREAMANKQSLYVVDEKLLRELKPDLIITQRLCDVCTVSADDALAAIATLDSRPTVLELSPVTLDDVLGTILQIGVAVGQPEKAQKVVAELSSRLTALQMKTTCYPLPRVLALEWTDPLWVAGHWLPEMIAIGGGVPLLANTGEPSKRIEFTDVQRANPDVILVACCGYNLERNVEQAAALLARPEWRLLPAVQHGQVYAVDANASYSRPSQSLVDGVEALADILQGNDDAPRGWRRIAS